MPNSFNKRNQIHYKYQQNFVSRRAERHGRKKNPSAMPRGKTEGLCYFGIFD